MITLFFATMSVQLAGCDGSNGRIPIQGTVVYQGVPVAEGAITFLPADAQKTQEGAVIVDGKYRIAAENGLFSGTYTVSISARDASQAKATLLDSAPGAPKRLFKELLPEQYNTKTKLSIEVTVGGGREFNFDLK